MRSLIKIAHIVILDVYAWRTHETVDFYNHKDSQCNSAFYFLHLQEFPNHLWFKPILETCSHILFQHQFRWGLWDDGRNLMLNMLKLFAAHRHEIQKYLSFPFYHPLTCFLAWASSHHFRDGYCAPILVIQMHFWHVFGPCWRTWIDLLRITKIPLFPFVPRRLIF